MRQALMPSRVDTLALQIIQCFKKFERYVDQGLDVPDQLFSEIQYYRYELNHNRQLYDEVKKAILLYYADQLDSLCDQYAE